MYFFYFNNNFLYKNMNTITPNELIKLAKSSYLRENHILKYIESGYDINSQDNYGNTALLVASSNNRIKIIYLLLKNGADPNIGNKYAEYPLTEASKNGHLKILKILLENGASFEWKYSYSALSKASYYGHIEIVKFLLEKGEEINKIDLNKKEYDFIIPLLNYSISCFSKLELIQLFLEYGIDVNSQVSNSLYTSLMTACNSNQYDIINLLLEYNADYNIKDSHGNKAINQVYNRKNYKAVQYLLNHKIYYSKIMKLKKLNLTLNKLLYKIK